MKLQHVTPQRSPIRPADETCESVAPIWQESAPLANLEPITGPLDMSQIAWLKNGLPDERPVTEPEAKYGRAPVIANHAPVANVSSAIIETEPKGSTK